MSTDLLTRPAPAHTSPSTASDQAAGPSRPRPGGLDWMDMLRVGAILAVVVIHAIGPATRESGTGWHSAWWWGADLLNAACLWCVPVFVMVSGALLLDPSRRIAGGDFL